MAVKRVAVTMGDPAGIGPYVAVKALESLANARAEFHLIGDAKTLARYGNLASQKNVRIIDLKNTKGVKAGKASAQSGAAAYEYLTESVELVKNEEVTAVVTAPVSKEAISEACGGTFRGHTEFFGDCFGISDPVMLMAGKKFSVVVMTRHIPLSDVSAALDPIMVRMTTELVGSFFQNKIGKKRKVRIGICSVNPHAGLSTYMGIEEMKILKGIEPLSKRFELVGPYPSEGLFMHAADFDCIIAAYHDQGMIPFKLAEFSGGVNVTLGLPCVRTSPAHGTAFDLMKSLNSVDHRPMLAAIKYVL